MACNHHHPDYLTPESSQGIFCRYCKIPLAKEIIPCKDRKKGTMQMLEGQDYLLESFERNFYYYKFVTFAKGEEMKKKEKEKDQVMEDKDQSNIINTQAQKIASLQAENERLNNIIIGLSEMLINKTVGKFNNNTNMMLDIQTRERE